MSLKKNPFFLFYLFTIINTTIYILFESNLIILKKRLLNKPIDGHNERAHYSTTKTAPNMISTSI